MENGVNCDGKSWKSHGILLSVFCGNPVYVRVGTIHRCIDISRYLSRDSYRDTLGNNFDYIFFLMLRDYGTRCLKLCAFWRSGAGLTQRHAPDESLHDCMTRSHILE